MHHPNQQYFSSSSEEGSAADDSDSSYHNQIHDQPSLSLSTTTAITGEEQAHIHHPVPPSEEITTEFQRQPFNRNIANSGNLKRGTTVSVSTRRNSSVRRSTAKRHNRRVKTNQNKSAQDLFQQNDAVILAAANFLQRHIKKIESEKFDLDWSSEQSNGIESNFISKVSDCIVLF